MRGFSLISCVKFDILDSGPVSEKPDEALFFVDKEMEEMEEMRATGMIHTLPSLMCMCHESYCVDY